MGDGIVFLEQLLDLSLGIAAGPQHVLLGVVQFILVELHLRLGDVKLVLDLILIAFRRRRKLPGEAGDQFLIGLDDRLRLEIAGHQFALFRGELGRMFLRFAQSVG